MKITDITGKEWEYQNCLSCSIVAKEIKTFGDIIFQSEYFLVAQDFSRPINGFLSIFSKRHVKSYSELTKEERIDFTELLFKVELALKNIGVCEFFNIYLAEYNEGHFHVQVMPRYKWMEDKRGTIIGNLNQAFNYAKENLNTAENLKVIKITLSRLKKELKRD